MSPGLGTAGRRRLYLDTSAYLCLLLGEAGSERLSEQTTGADLLSSVLLVLEAKRALVRLAREGTLKAEQYKTCLERVDEDADEPIEAFLSLDAAQQDSARERPAGPAALDRQVPFGRGPNERRDAKRPRAGGAMIAAAGSA